MHVRMLLVAVLSLVLCASTASLRQPPDNSVLLAHTPPVSLTKRQINIGSPDPPSDSSCTSTCTPVNDEISLVSILFSSPESMTGVGSPRRSCDYPSDLVLLLPPYLPLSA
ncbi:hypothetical protein JVU11DRAFT_1267 [Chiua virens]|nr:hypothetical protein JVU11DRAFT_1267 [Chiua virens]